jgi:heavy metal sensor kinase
MVSSVRVRITLWYTLVLGASIVGFSFVVYAAISHTVYSRLDRSLINMAATAAHLFESEIGENRGDVRAAAQETLSELKLGDVKLAVLQNGNVLVSDYPEGRASEIAAGAFLEARDTQTPALTNIGGFGGDGARVAIVRLKSVDSEYFVALAQPLEETARSFEELARVFYLAVPVALVVAGIGGLFLARKSLAPVDRMTEQAMRISAQNLHDRLEVGYPADELGRLALVLNDLLSRLDRSFENMRQFTADASHEVRTPLSIIRGEAEVALSQNRDESEYRESLSVILDEARRLSLMVDDMLALVRADAGQHKLKKHEFYLNDLVDECIRAVHVLALNKGVTLNSTSPADIPFFGDEDLLRRMLLNLLDNAIKYTPSGGLVEVSLSCDGEFAKISVRDNGIGVPAEASSQIFERFYRVGKARSRADGGSGLGLSITKWVAEAHNGTIDLVSKAGSGSTFTVTLPRRGD